MFKLSQRIFEGAPGLGLRFGGPIAAASFHRWISKLNSLLVHSAPTLVGRSFQLFWPFTAEG